MMHIGHLPRFAALLASVASALVQPSLAAAAPSAASPLALPNVETWTLENGLQVALMRVAAAPVASVQLWYHVGSKDEPPNRRGSAHMFEHMMFRGSEHVPPEEHARLLARVGGYVNAFTTEDATAYINVVPVKYVDFALRLEAERMRKLLFRPDMIATEREVVKEEIRQQENNPVAKGLLRFFEVAYQKHPYAWTAAGTIADLDATTVADLQAFYDRYYVPNNALLTIVGDVSKEDVAAAVQNHFGAIAKQPEPPRPANERPEPPQQSKRREVAPPAQIGVVFSGYHVPGAAHEDIYALQVLSLILGNGESSRLHERLVQKDRIAVQSASPLFVREHPGLFVVFGVYLPPVEAEAVESALLAEIALMQQKGPAERELRKAKNQLQSSFAFGLESVDGLAQQIGSSWILTGDPTQWVRDLEQLEAVGAKDVQRVARQYLQESNKTTVVVPPAGAEG